MKLEFNHPDGQMFFEFIFEGFIIGGNIETRKGLTVIRRELSILDKLEKISIPYPCGKKFNDIEVKRELKKFDAENFDLMLELTEDELQLIKNYMCMVPWASGQPARNFIKTYDWIEFNQIKQDPQLN